MFTITEHIDIGRERGEVFAFLTDPANRARWDASVISEELLTPPPVTVGSAIRTRMNVMGRPLTFGWRVTAFHPPQTMAATSTSGTMPTSLRFSFAEHEDGCRVTATIEASPAGMLRLVEPIVAQTASSTLAAGLARARELLESGSS
ncbi:SRPBCC family protein [Microbacterium sp. A1-JK]|uniref:SRPBCC family protein n=1 Tax=Microbacterium sp. A1-JK TaxID=3177516 RepID=UPI003889690E